VIHVVTPYSRDAPSSRVRVYEWLDRIAEPFEVNNYVSHRNASPKFLMSHPGKVLAAEQRVRSIGSVARLLLHREASPLSRGRLETRLLRRADVGVYDFDDALQWDTGAGSLLRRLAPKAPKTLAAVRHADRVIAGNPILADWASQHNDDVVVIPSCVSPDSYRAKTTYELNDPPRLGWIGSTQNESYIRLIAPALQEIHRLTGARLTLISSTQPSLDELESFTDRISWSEDSQRSDIADFDIGIAPLPDAPYERGKCGYKLLQYAAAGVPVVASPVGVNAQILAEFRTPGPTSSAEWVESIVDLLGRSGEARAELGTRAHTVVQKSYSFDAWQSRWEQAIGLDVTRDATP
jgi:glycosyltransferase involved in cell wall biosynthesis